MLHLFANFFKHIIDFIGDFLFNVFGWKLFILQSSTIVSNLSSYAAKELKDNLDILDGLHAYCEGYNIEEDIGATGRYLLNKLALQSFQCRGDVLKYANDHPEMNQVPMERPVFIVTLPRTGSNYLHCLLATDKRWFVPEYWQLAQPLPIAEFPRNSDDTERILNFQSFIDIMTQLSGSEHMKIMPTDPEDLMISLNRSMINFIPYNYKSTDSYRQWLESRPKGFWEHAYKLVKLELQFALSADGLKGRRLLAMNHICFCNPSALLEVFPDAQFIHIHRDPAKLVPSFCNLCRTMNTAFRKSSSDNSSNIIGNQITELLEKSAKSLTELRQKVPNINVNMVNKPPKFLDVEYSKLMDDPLGVLKTIYEDVGMEWTEKCQNGFQEFIDQKPTNNSNSYNCEEFGINESDLRRRFAFYMDLFGIRPE